LLPCWHGLVKTFDIKGFRCHDARLVAAMQNYGITQLLTFNGNDFKVFSITIVDPDSL
jgi:predicted nucleic acid-binding protein